MTVRASILIPTHDRSQTLAIAVASALRQSVHDLEVLIVGDGVNEAVRAMANELAAKDSRVRFFDNPKGANHGETYRHNAIVVAESNAIFYLCDDDLFMPEHVSDLLKLLETHDFVQSLNGFVNFEGDIELYPADLSDPETVKMHLSDEVRFNSVSLTGLAHSREFYLAMNDPWETTPDGLWPDHYQACKFFRAGCRSATSRRMTALQFPSTYTERENWPVEDRVAELARWSALIEAGDGQARIDELVAAGTRLRLDREYQRSTRLAASEEHLRERVEHHIAELTHAHMRTFELVAEHESAVAAQKGHLSELMAVHRAELAEVHERYRELVKAQQAELDEMLASNSWRFTAPLRWARRRLGGGH